MTRQELAIKMCAVAETLRTQLDEDDPLSPEVVTNLCDLVDAVAVVMNQFPICLELTNPAAVLLARTINAHVGDNIYKPDESVATTQCRAALLRIYEVLCEALGTEK